LEGRVRLAPVRLVATNSIGNGWTRSRESACGTHTCVAHLSFAKIPRILPVAAAGEEEEEQAQTAADAEAVRILLLLSMHRLVLKATVALPHKRMRCWSLHRRRGCVSTAASAEGAKMALMAVLVAAQVVAAGAAGAGHDGMDGGPSRKVADAKQARLSRPLPESPALCPSK
jgi:hypothetical protein